MRRKVRLFRIVLVMLTMLTMPAVVVAQNMRVTGIVTDSGGAAVVGAAVSVEGTQIGAVTDGTGSFSIDAPARGTIVVSYLGYETQQLPLGQSSYTIRLVPSVQSLEEVVVVGYGTQRKSDLTGAITSVKSSELTRVGGANATEALQGKAGVYILNQGSPGSAPVVRIRGVGTNGNPNPLYVVDGMFVDNLQYLNQHDIESMEVLKDASATAIYGSRGANGVILVTTKQGRSGEAVIDYNGSEGFQFLSRKYDVLDATGYAQLQNIVADGMGRDRDPAYANPQSMGRGTDWIDLVTRNGWVRDHRVSASGGSDRMTYNASVGWYDQKGVMEYTKYQRFTARLNNSYKVSERVTVGHNITFASSTNTSIGSMAGARVMNSIYSIH